MKWDLFCRVIDNHGDVGVCWRVSAELAARGEEVRLWIDDPSALQWMAPGGAPRVQVVHWTGESPDLGPGDVAVEAFGCDPPPAFVARMASAQRPPAWLNLEYLSAEPYVERSHGLPSPVMSGPGAGLTKHFVYPGFTGRTGGLLREADLPRRRSQFDRAGWRERHGIPVEGSRVISLFCYEPDALPDLLAHLAGLPDPTDLLVTAGRATAAVRPYEGQLGNGVRLHFLPLMSQRAYDELLWASDLNFVRGEDSFVRGLLAGVPFVWQIYPQQEDDAHHAKLEAFLAWLQPPPDLRDFFLAWNDVVAAPLPPLDPAGWRDTFARALERAQALPELATELQRFAAGRVRI
ncbi:MAG TPA: elongation factor P maturation arginine rhamnosyltransferase EarP [Ramlibacter sp.]|uniref:elongation factor P maturation arginine rhamnosyltransferase EarP n=1 Tax=Ramlibacter sp. TaxID=1917967 RepID=UPI002ED09F36